MSRAGETTSCTNFQPLALATFSTSSRDRPNSRWMPKRGPFLPALAALLHIADRDRASPRRRFIWVHSVATSPAIPACLAT